MLAEQPIYHQSETRFCYAVVDKIAPSLDWTDLAGFEVGAGLQSN